MSNKQKKDKKEFDKYTTLKYALLWLGIPASVIYILNYYGIRDIIIVSLVVAVVVLLLLNYMKDKEIESLKNGE